MNFTIEKNPEQPLRVYLELDCEGDVVLKVTDGTTKANIGFLSAETKSFRLFDYSENRKNLLQLGFAVEDNKIAGF